MTDLGFTPLTNTRIVSLGEEIEFNTGMVLRLCSCSFGDGKKTIFLINTKTGTIYRGKTEQGTHIRFKDATVDFNCLNFSVNDILEVFHLDSKYKVSRVRKAK